MKLLLCITFNLFIFSTVFCQQKCGTMDALNYGHQNEAFKKETLQNLKDYVGNNYRNKVNPGEVYTIPCVVHVVWRVQSENISDQFIYDGLAVLNEDFRKLNKIEEVKSEFQSLIADSEIEFCLANVDPNGNPTTGINRVKTSIRNLAEDYGENKIKFTNDGGTDAWPTDQYLNIWVGNISTDGLLGYAQFPNSGSRLTDGIVLDDRSFGRAGGNDAIEDDGTTSHEVGHWLGLFHIWGDDDGCEEYGPPECICEGSDGIQDTNNSGGSARGCRKDSYSCDSPDMIQNFMDYSNCSAFFTPNQVNVMRSNLRSGGFRDGLSQSGKCADLIPNDVAITKINFPAFDEIICTRNFKPAITIANNGTDTLKKVIFKMKLSSGVEEEYTWEGALNFAQYENIELGEMISSAGSKNIEISVVSVNDVLDENKTNHTLNNDFFIEPQSADNLPLNEDFESNWPNNNWFNASTDDNLEFLITDEVTHFGENCLLLQNYNNEFVGATDEIISKNLNIASYTNAKLRFFYAYTNIDENSIDELVVLLTPDCGVHFDTLYYAKGKNLATTSAQTDYFSPVASEWDRVVIDLAEYENLKFANFHIKFISGLGNNFYLDDISIFGKDAIVDVVNFENEILTVYPNPFENNFIIDLPKNEIKNTLSKITIFDAAGKVVYTKEHSFKNNSLNINSIQSKGIYYLHISANEKHFINKIIKL